jgi:thioesterase domain-containing protein
MLGEVTADMATSRQEAVDYSLDLLNYVRGLARSYRPKPIRAPIKLFLSKAESKRWFLTKNRAWDRLSGKGFNLTVVSGDHFSILDSPNVKPIAHAIKAALANSSADQDFRRS